MSVVQPANPRDVQDFQFKLLCRLRVFTGQDGTFTSAVNLVAPASKYGLIFVGCPTGIQVITSSSIIGLEHPSGNTGGEITNYPRRELPLPSQPSHLNVSCDQSYLVVAIKKDGCSHALIYSVPSFVAKNIVLVTEIRLCSKPDTSVLELSWNPGITNILAACLSDGSMAAYELKPSGVDISTLPPAVQANCFCWSPKGKQLVVGSEGGTLTQYKPDLKAVKTFSSPNIGSGNVAVVNVLWLSNFQFAAVYRDKVNTDERPGLLIVNAPKTGNLSFVNYEDICYSGGDLRSSQFYIIHQPTWNILMVASANSMEVGVMGLREDQISWEQWTQEDAARAELPLSVDKQETFPVGLGLDISTQHELPWGENQSLTPMPLLHILSHQGVLCLFYAINLRPDAACICSPPERLSDESGLSMFTTTVIGDQISANVSSGVIPTAAPQHIAGDGLVKTLDQPPEFSAPLQSGSALTSLDAGVRGMRAHLAQTFENVSTAQPSSSFGFGTTLSNPSSSGFGAGLTKAPSTDFGAGLTVAPSSGIGASLIGTSSPGFGAGLTVAPSSGFGASLTGTPSTGFGVGLTGAPSTTFGTGISNPSTTSIGIGLSNTSPTSFGTGLINPPSTAHGTAPSISFGTGLSTQSSISTGSSASNPPSIGFGAGLDLSSSTVQAAKPIFSFLSSSSTTISAANLKPAPVQTAANFTFTAPTFTSTPVAQQTSKQATLPVMSQLQSSAVKPQSSLIGSNSALQNPEQMVGSSITITKVPSTPPAKVEATTLEAKVPTQSQVKQVTPPAAAVSTKPAVAPTVNNSVFYNAIKEEVLHFERELTALLSRVNGINVQVGSEDEKRTLCQKADAMDEFWRELKDTTQAQSSEIHSLKSVLMEAFAWAEEAKSRAQHLNNPMYIQLARSQALDPVSARYVSNIKHLVYYVENQLRQVNEQLDSNWLEFQDSYKPSVKNKMHIPSLESVYQSMVMHNNILNKQRAIMADIARRTQDQGRSTQIPLISSAVLARVRDKEASQLGKGETELSRLAENLVKMKLGPPDMQTNYGMGLRYRRLSRKKESLLRDLLSQSTVTRVCPTKPSCTTLGGISTGKPIVNKVDTLAVAATALSRDMSRLSAGIAITDPKSSSSLVNVTKSESPQAPLFSFGSSRPGELDATSKGFASRGYSLVSAIFGPPIKEAPSGTTMVASSGEFTTTLQVNKAKPNVPDSAFISKSNNSHASNLAGKGSVAGDFSFNSALPSGKPTVPGNFSFGMGLSKVPSLSKLSDTTKRLEDYYEELTPPGTPDYSCGEAVPSPANSASSSSFAFSFPATPTTTKSGIITSSPASGIGSSLQRSPLMPLASSSSFAFSFPATPTTTKSGIITSSPASGIGSSLQRSPLMSLDSIVAGIGDGNSASKSTTKPTHDSKSIASSSANNATSGTAFSIGSLALSQPQQGGSILGKADEPKKPPETFKFSVTSSPFSSVTSPSPSVSSSGVVSQVTPPKAPATTTSVNFKTPLLTTFSTQNAQDNSPTPVNIFGGGGGDSQKPSPSFFASRTTSVSSSLTNISAQAATSMFGNLTTGSPAKQPASLGHVFGTNPTTPATVSIFAKQSTDFTSTTATTSFKESEPQRSESSPKSQSPAVTSSASKSLFSQSPSLFGSLSLESSSKPVSPGSIFGGGSNPIASNFIFGKQQTSTESQNSNNVQNTPETTTAAVESSEAQVQKSESHSKNTEASIAATIFSQPPATTVDEKPESSERTENQLVPDTSSILGGAKTESATAVTFSFTQLASTIPSSTSAPQTLAAGKPGSIFGNVVSPAATSQQTVAPVTAAATTSPVTQTTPSVSTTFSFSLPALTDTSAPFGQKTTNLFGQPVNSATPVTTSSGSFFAQSICSPTAFGQNGGSVSIPPATTAVKTNIFGQATATTTTPSVFGRGGTNTTQSIFSQTSSSTTPLFGQASSTGSLFLGGGSTGGFGSKSIFGQSGGTIFGQSGSPGFGTSGGSVFIGGGGGGGEGASVFGGGSGSSPGGIFQPSTGGSIFCGSSTPSSGSGAGGAFSSGLSQSISQSGFGSPPAFQNKPGGFGGSPVFDRGTAGFGTSPTFGGAPTFGGSPSFGSPGKVFGSTSPTSSVGFGSAGQQSSTFESLATQNTMSFGNLAQNQSQGFGSPSPPPPPPVFGRSPPQQQASAPAFSTGSTTFGGSSFSSWR